MTLVPSRVSDLFFMRLEIASELYVDEVLDGSGRLQYIDTMGSVRGLDLDRDPMWPSDKYLDEQVRRDLNAS